MFIAIAGAATAFNFLVILWKFSKNRNLDATLDLGIFVAIAFLFSGTITGLEIGMVASAIVSLYLLIFPPKFPSILS